MAVGETVYARSAGFYWSQLIWIYAVFKNKGYVWVRQDSDE